MQILQKSERSMLMNQPCVLVTGASRGIGKSTALAFAGAGYHVFLNAHQSTGSLEEVKEQILETGGSAAIVLGDVGRPEEVASIFDAIYRECSCLDVLVNNAGIAHIGLLMDMTDEEWDKMIRTDLSSVFYCCRAALEPMIQRQKGRIINVTSIWGRRGASCEAAYSAAKGGVESLTKALAKEMALSNIQVNAISCGVMDTAMNDTLTGEEKSRLEEQIPAGRFGTPEEAARLILQVAQAPEYLTGQVIGLDGGF